MFVLASGSFAGALDVASGSSLSLAIRILVAGVLVVAAVTKLRQPWVAADAMVHFGVLREDRAWTGRALGVLELGIAVGLLIAWRSTYPGIGAALLFFAFAFLIGSALRRGESFACGCLSAREDHIGVHTLARTIVLLMLAVAAAAAPVRGVLDFGDVVNAGVVAGAATGVWALVASYLRATPAWRTFLDSQVDWQLAAELNAEVLPGRPE